MIISRAAAAELLGLTAGLGKGLSAPCTPWGCGDTGVGVPGCCPGGTRRSQGG